MISLIRCNFYTMATNSPGAGNAIKRIMNEAKDWNDDPDPTGSMFAAPLEVL